MPQATENGPPLRPSPRLRASSAVEPVFFGAIDLGTTSCRLMVSAHTPNGLRIVERASQPVLLGEGLHTNGFLTENAMNRTLAALRHFVKRLARWPLSRLRVVATEVCRRAANTADFLQRVRQETGLHIDVITAREEAELALEGCMPLLRRSRGPSPSPERVLLFDIGGGSTELSWIRLDRHGKRPTLISTTSLKIGIVTLREMFAGKMRDVYPFMVDHAASLLEKFEEIHHIRREIRQGGVQMLGTSGTVTTLAAIASSLKHYRRAAMDGLVLPASALLAPVPSLRHMETEELAAHPCIGSRRAPLLLSGCAIFEALQRFWPVSHVMIADRGLRDGMVLRMARAKQQPDWKKVLPPSLGQAAPRLPLQPSLRTLATV